jgi:hypothetical protein
MSKSNNGDDYVDFENVSYIIQCIYFVDYTNLGIGTMLFGTILLIVIIIFASNYYFMAILLFLLFLFYGYCFIYDSKKGKKENVIITLVKKELGEEYYEYGKEIVYYFYTDTNKRYKVCKGLYNFFEGNETIQVVIEDDDIHGLVKIIDWNENKFEETTTNEHL